jgi:hypothetical protein
VTPVDLTTLQPGTTLQVGTQAQALAVGNGGTTAWVAGGNGTLVPVDLRTGTVGRAVEVGGQPNAVVIPPAPSG